MAKRPKKDDQKWPKMVKHGPKRQPKMAKSGQ